MNHKACVLCERDPRSDPRHAQEGMRLPYYRVLVPGITAR